MLLVNNVDDKCVHQLHCNLEVDMLVDLVGTTLLEEAAAHKTSNILTKDQLREYKHSR